MLFSTCFRHLPNPLSLSLSGVAGSPGIGKDGKDGAPGKDGVNGRPGASGPRGATGAPGYCDPSNCIGRPPPLYMMNGGKKSSSFRKGP